jgi:integrase
MAKKASPWYWEARNGWYVIFNGKRHRLGDHPEGAAKPKQSSKTGKWNTPESIDQAFRGLQGGETPQQAADSEYVVTYLQAFLKWCKENRAGQTTERYFDFLDSFERRHHGLKIAQLSSDHVTTWLEEQAGWNSTTKRNAITALQRAFNWCCKNKGLARNPIRGMEKPKAKRRTAILTPGEFDQVLQHVSDGPFRDLLIVSYDCGARPFEVKGLERRHLQLEKERAVIPAEEAKGGHTRVIYFPTERSMEIIRRLAAERLEGKLFLNSRGRPWTGFAVSNRFVDIEVAIGIAEMKKRGIESSVTDEAIAELMKTLPKTRKDKSTGKEEARKVWHIRQQAKEKLVKEEAKAYGVRFHHYALRHTFITRKLVAGVDSHIVAALSGHKDTGMIDRVYSHVAENHAFMLEQAKRDVSPKKDA